MKYILVSAWEKVVVYKNGRAEKILSEGNHFIGFGRQIEYYDIRIPVTSSINMNAVITDEHFSEEFETYLIQPGSIGLRYIDEMFTEVLVSGKYTYWKGGINQRIEIIRTTDHEVQPEYLPLMTNSKIIPYVTVCRVESNEKGVLYCDGRFSKVLESGAYYFWKNITTLTIMRVDLRRVQIELSGQEVLTKDKSAIRLTLFASYRVIDVIKAIVENKDYEKQVYVLIQLVLREYVGSMTLDQLLENREELLGNMNANVASQLKALGIELMALGIRDIILPGDMKEIMNQVLMADKKAQANAIMRREETASTRSLLNTAKLLDENSTMWKLKEMEYVERIAERISTIELNASGSIVDQMKNLFITK